MAEHLDNPAGESEPGTKEEKRGEPHATPCMLKTSPERVSRSST